MKSSKILFLKIYHPTILLYSSVFKEMHCYYYAGGSELVPDDKDV